MDQFGSDCSSRLTRILDVFESLGYPRSVVTQWSLPASDVTDLCALASESGAERVLEIGSFVGTSAFLMAQALPKAEIFSVDPNLPLDVEFTAMGADGGSADLTRKTLEVARLAATKLGLTPRVRFLEGGFAVGSSFALDDIPVPVIGPEVCRAHGPFDFIFVDGLHFEDAVFADVNLALSALTPNGTIALHDCIGYWGSHVRRAVSRILEVDESLSLTHAPYDSLTRAIGTLSRSERASPSLEARAQACFGDVPALAQQLARLLRSIFPHASFVKRDALATLVASHIADGEQDSPRVVLAFDALDGVRPTEQPLVLLDLIEGADALVLGLTPPGEVDAAGSWSRPLARHVQRLDALGFDTHDIVTPFLEPYTHSFGDRSVIERRTSFLLNTVVAVRRGGRCSARFAASSPLTPSSARTLTDLRLQLLFAARSHADTRARYIATHDGATGLRKECERLGAALHDWSSWRVHLGRYRLWRRG